jgi:protein-histidine pros-kinase
MKLPGPLNAEQEKQLETIRTSGRHLLSLINDLLDLTKIESGKVYVVREPTSVTEVIHEVVRALQPAARKKRLAFRVELPEDEVTIESDRRALSQILLNLTNNAIKFTDRGEVAIVLESRREGRRSVVEVHIRDTGVGIKPEDRGRLFQAFAQLDSSAARLYEGTGLGLHLSQKLAELLGGGISFESEYGAGSVFTLRLEREE